EDGIRDLTVTGVQTCALPIWPHHFVSRSDRAVRRPRADRAAGALPCRVDAALAVLRVSGAGRAGRRLCDAAAADHPGHVLAAARSEERRVGNVGGLEARQAAV